MATSEKSSASIFSKASIDNISRSLGMAPFRPNTLQCGDAPVPAMAEPMDSDSEARLQRINVHEALGKSLVGNLHGLPFPVQFRNRGALDAWRSALGATSEGMAILQDWSGPHGVNSLIREEILGYCEYFRSYTDTDPFAAVFGLEVRLASLASSTNLMFELHNGTIIETTPALETLLTYSDIDLSLPVGMVAPPFQAQYVRFGETASQLLPPILPGCVDITIDGRSFLCRRQQISTWSPRAHISS